MKIAFIHNQRLFYPNSLRISAFFKTQNIETCFAHIRRGRNFRRGRVLVYDGIFSASHIIKKN